MMQRLASLLDRALRSVDADPRATWRQPRAGAELAVLPVGLDVSAAVPLLIRGLLASMERDRNPGMRIQVAFARDTVTQARSGYVGKGVLTASRLLDSPAPGGALAADSAALLVTFLADDLYRDVVARAGEALPVGGFRWVSVDLPDHGWHGAGWLSAWRPGSLVPPPKRLGKMVRDSFLPALGGLADEGVSLADSLYGPDGVLTQVAGDDGDPLLAGEEHHAGASYESHDPAGTDHAGTDHDADLTDYSANEHAEADSHVSETTVYFTDHDGYIDELGSQTDYDYDASADHYTGDTF